MADIKRGEGLLSNAVIERHVGTTSYLRGRAYANKNRISGLTLDDSGTIFTALAHGSAPRPYKTKVTLQEAKDGSFVIRSSDCSCPVGYACKHVAAVALLGRGLLYDKRVPEAEIVERPSVATVPKTGDWEKKLITLFGDKPADSTTPLALLFEVLPANHYNSYYWYPQSAANRVSTSRLVVRPASFNLVTGKWVLSEVTWSNIRYARPEFNTEQVEFLRDMLVQYSSRRAYYSQDKYVVMDDFSSPALVELLKRGRELGVAYLHAYRDREPIQLSDEPAKWGFAVDKTPYAGLSLQAELTFEDRPLLPERIGFVGNPAYFIYVWSGQQKDYKVTPIMLIPLASPLDEDKQKAIKGASNLTIPKHDMPRFIANHYPKLAQTANFRTAEDLDLPLPELHPPELCLGISRSAGNAIRLVWSWRYIIGDQTLQLSLYPDDQKPDETVRHEAVEAELLAEVGRVVKNIDALWEVNSLGAERLRSPVALTGIEVVRFLQDLLPELRQVPGLSIKEPATLPVFEEFTDKPTIEFGVQETDQSSTDWFDLSVVIKLGEEEVPFEAVFSALAENEEYVILESGSYFRLDHPELTKLRALIEEARSLQDKPSDSLRISPFQAALWDELVALGIVAKQTAVWQQSIQGLLNLADIPKVTIPKSLQATLRPYQADGYQWLYFLWEHRLGGILADDMGLGKTLQAIALLLQVKQEVSAKDRRPALVIAPTSVSANWISELERFAPSLKIVYLRQRAGSPRAMRTLVKKADVVVSTYALFRLNFEDYQACDWSIMILDEAQFVKNHQSKSYQYCRKLSVPFKVALTGTPLENNLMELWALLSITAPGLFPSPKRFSDFYQRPIEKAGDREILAQLRRRIRPFMLRRTKENVATELPPKIEQVLDMELLPEHKKIYDLYLQRERQRVLGLLGDMDKNRFMIFKSLTTLRLLSLDPKLVDAKKYKGVESTKLVGLLEQIDSILSEGHRALVFSQFTSFLQTVRTSLDNLNTPYLYLDGKTKNRGELLKDFQGGAVPLFLISLKAGGFGLNLTEADYCFLLDPWWNPAVEQQAIDRTHRIGQTKQVFVYRLVAKGTIEEKVMALKAKKAKLFRSVMDEDAIFSNAITAEDIRSLFEKD
jgi:superfamily II DNA or RNA helicase